MRRAVALKWVGNTQVKSMNEHKKIALGAISSQFDLTRNRIDWFNAQSGRLSGWPISIKRQLGGNRFCHAVFLVFARG